MDEYMLTTYDNPFNPFTHFEEWRAYDESNGHHTLSFLARVVRSSHDLSVADELLSIQEGIDEIVRMNVSGIYMKVKRDSKIVPLALPSV